MSDDGTGRPLAPERRSAGSGGRTVKRAVFDPGRISALSDAVFAIAMTLLVLNLRLPDVGG